MEPIVTVLLTIAALVLGLLVGSRIGLHLSALAIRRGAMRYLTADEWTALDTLMDKALGGGE